MESYKFDRLPPPTIEFLRIVNGVEDVRIFCKDCDTSKVMSLKELDLPDDMPFPPDGSLGHCNACGGNNVTAEAVFPPQREKATPSDLMHSAIKPSDPLSRDEKFAKVRNTLGSILNARKQG